MAQRAKTSGSEAAKAPADTKHADVYAAMAAVIGEVGPVAKSAHNAQHGYAARSIDDVMGACQPVLARHGVFLRPEVRDLQRSEYQTSRGNVMQDTVATVAWHFCHRSGSELSVIMAGEGSDAGDKSTSKAMAMSLKYALLQALCIPVGDPDPDADGGGERASRSRPPRALTEKPPPPSDDDLGAGTGPAEPPPARGAQAPKRGGGARASSGTGDTRKITAPQQKRLWAKAHHRAEQVHTEAETIVRSVYERFGVERTQAITRGGYDAIIGAIEQWIPEDAGTGDPALDDPPF